MRLSSSLKSFCSEEADWKGHGQRIISYSLFNDSTTKDPGDKFSNYVEGISKNLERITLLYPGWSVRIYSNCDLDGEFCRYACLDEVTWCDVRNSSLSDRLYTVNPRIWRFMALGDPTVDIFLSRDLDSWITEREQEIVMAWASTKFIFHAARDGWNFQRAISAGTWGVKNYDLPSSELESLRMEFISQGMKNPRKKTLDEDLLHTYIFEKYPNRILVHDSYSCKKNFSKNVYVPSHPYPKQRRGNTTRIALEIRLTNLFKAKKCPMECRPSYGKNWTYC